MANAPRRHLISLFLLLFLFPLFVPGCECFDANGNQFDCSTRNGGTPTRSICTYYGVGSDSCPTGTGTYCYIATGNCLQRIASQSGVCEVKSTGFCTMNYDPQCGCNGITYSNGCEAAAAGANIAYVGECR